MNDFMKRTSLFVIMLMLALASPAYAQNEIPAPTAQAEDDGLLPFPPGNVLYDIELFTEDIEEALTFDPARKALLKQRHLNERIRELQEDAIKKNSRNAAKILKKLQTKRIEIAQTLEDLKPKCADVTTGEITPCKDFSSSDNSAKKRIYEGLKRQNTDVLTRLLASDKMPEQSKQGLRNAIEKSGLVIEEKVETDEGNVVQANMTQSYRSTAVSYIPFKTAMVYVKGTNKKYSVVLNADSATVSDEVTLSSPQYNLYPTESQTNELMQIARNINSKKKMSWQDSIKIMNLWMDIQKEKVN